jgi:hypothetical protein
MTRPDATTVVRAVPEPSPRDAASILERERLAVRSAYTVQPLTPAERQAEEDARWARHDPEVIATYEGEFVVPFQGRIVAHGTNASLVLAEAAGITGRPVECLPLVGIVDPALELPH